MEQFTLRTAGGPHAGTYLTDDTQTPWPLPDILVDDGGHYQKVSESSLPPIESDDAHMIRGAMYNWVPDTAVTLSSPEVPEIDAQARQAYQDTLDEYYEDE
jgi:hypothetical protein